MDKEIVSIIGRRYYKGSLWLVAGLALVGLFVINLCDLSEFINPLVISALYSLVTNIAYGEAWKASARVSSGALTRFYLGASAVRLLLAALVTAAVCVLDGNRQPIINFVIVFFAFYMAMLVFDGAFFARLERKLNQKDLSV